MCRCVLCDVHPRKHRGEAPAATFTILTSTRYHLISTLYCNWPLPPWSLQSYKGEFPKFLPSLPDPDIPIKKHSVSELAPDLPESTYIYSCKDTPSSCILETLSRMKMLLRFLSEGNKIFLKAGAEFFCIKIRS